MVIGYGYRLWYRLWFDGREREGLVIFYICQVRPICMNLVLEWLRKSRFEVIQGDISEIVS